MGSTFVLGNPKKCVGCKACMSACLVKHFAKGDVPTARLEVVECGGHHKAALACRHCFDAPCVQACPMGALFFDGARVGVDMHRCIGCGGCEKSCPYGAATVIERTFAKAMGAVKVSAAPRHVVVKCDLCYDRASGPACIEACTSSALSLVDQDDIDRLQKAEHSAGAGAVVA